MSAAPSTLIDRVRAYAHHPDPRVAAGNTVALLVASSQPFYPLYLYLLVSENIEASFFTFLSTPFFLAVPAVARIDSRAGRALLPMAGIANTILCTMLFGTASAVEMFLIPCAVLALLLFRPGERLVAIAIAAGALGVYLLSDVLHDAPVYAYSLAEYEAFARLNIMSAAMLTGFAALIFSNVLAQAETASSPEAAREKETEGG